jgi:hypothetical protein
MALSSTRCFRFRSFSLQDMSHPQMPKAIDNARIAILTCPFEPPKPKTTHKLDVTSAEDFQRLRDYEQRTFLEMVKQVCNFFLLDVIIYPLTFFRLRIAVQISPFANGVSTTKLITFFSPTNSLQCGGWVAPTLRFVACAKSLPQQLIAIATGGRIVPRFAELNPEKLGFAGRVRELQFGTTKVYLLDFNHHRSFCPRFFLTFLGPHACDRGLQELEGCHRVHSWRKQDGSPIFRRFLQPRSSKRPSAVSMTLCVSFGILFATIALSMVAVPRKLPAALPSMSLPTRLFSALIIYCPSYVGSKICTLVCANFANFVNVPDGHS